MIKKYFPIYKNYSSIISDSKKILMRLVDFIFFPLIVKDMFKFRSLNDDRFSLKIKNFRPCVEDKTTETAFDLHYIYHPAWAARVLSHTKPIEHVDISSTLTFSTIVSAFIPTKFYDYRPANILLKNLDCKKGNLNSLPFRNNSILSLSCMHTIEHIGLGRYGDKIDPRGDLKAINELKRVLAKNGNLLFVVPVGKPKIAFNAHRIYSYEQIISYFGDLHLIEFTLISRKNQNIIFNANPLLVKEENYGCGCFWFTKK